jgi:hypothetical protein
VQETYETILFALLAQVPKASAAGRIAGEWRSPEDTSSRETSNRGGRDPADATPDGRVRRRARHADPVGSLPDEEVVSNNVSALNLRGGATTDGTREAADADSAEQQVPACLPPVHWKHFCWLPHSARMHCNVVAKSLLLEVKACGAGCQLCKLRPLTWRADTKLCS